MKRILTIQDISCVGKCSLTVALPIISACGVECGVIPTALLAVHTAFPSYTFTDLTEEISPITDKFKELNISFDAVYTGYLGSFEQLALVDSIFSVFASDGALKLVDPVMADNGKLYKGFSLGFVSAMKSLCSKADIIVPNMTEASFMLGTDYVESGYSESYVKDILKRLCDMGPRCALLTGIGFSDKEIGAYGYDSVKDEFFCYFNKRLNSYFHGTGDIFASAFCGAVMRDRSLYDSTRIAVDFTLESMEKTLADPNARDYGVNFEEAIPKLIELVNNN